MAISFIWYAFSVFTVIIKVLFLVGFVREKHRYGLMVLYGYSILHQ